MDSVNNVTGITLQTKLARYTTLTDGSLSLTFHSSKEILDEYQLLEVYRMNRKEGWLLFKPNPIQESEIPTTPAKTESKPPSVRLRAVLYRLWQQGEKKMSAEEHYQIMMEKLINHYKEKLV